MSALQSLLQTEYFSNFGPLNFRYISYLIDAREKLFCNFSLFEVGRVKIKTTFPHSGLECVIVSYEVY